MKLKINKACDLASISVLPPRRTGGSGSRGGGMSAASAAAAAAAGAAVASQMQQRCQTMSQQQLSQGGGDANSIWQGVNTSASAVASQQQCTRTMSQQLFSQGGGASFSQGGIASASAVAAAVASQRQLSQTLSHQLFSEGGGASASSVAAQQQQRSLTMSQGGGGAGASLLNSQLSQALEENLPDLRAHNQIFGLHDDDSSQRMLSSLKEESQLQLANISGNPTHRWRPSLPDAKYQVPTEDIERKFQHLASSVHKMGMVLDSVQNDVMQLNRAMKEASLDAGVITQKIVLLENSLQQIIKGQGDLKAILEDSTKSNPHQPSTLISHTHKLDAISSILSVWPEQVREDIRQLQGDIPRIFTEMEGIVTAIKSLNSSPATMQVLPDQCCTSNARPQMNRTQVANGRPQMNRTPVTNGILQINPIPVEKCRPLINQVPLQKVLPVPSVCQRKLADPKSKVEQENAKTAAQKLAGWVARTQEKVTIQIVRPQIPTKKEPVRIMVDSDDDSDGRSSCVILKAEPIDVMSHLVEEPTSEEALEILRRARKRRRKGEQATAICDHLRVHTDTAVMGISTGTVAARGDGDEKKTPSHPPRTRRPNSRFPISVWAQ